jgi:serine/threonine protein phosphatase PrpC
MREIIDTGYAQMTRRQKIARINRLSSPIDPGISRDYSCRDEGRRVFAIADGVGGSLNAAEAARAACETFVSAFIGEQYPESARQARRRLKGGLLELLDAAASKHMAATTLTGVVVTPDSRATYLHIGDSGLLVCRKDEVISVTSEQADEHDGSMLLNYLGYSPDWQTYERRHELALTRRRNELSQSRREAEWGSFKLHKDDTLLLVTDGVLGDRPDERLSEEEWQYCTRRKLGAQAIADLLLWRSKKADDTTVMALSVSQSKNR